LETFKTNKAYLVLADGTVFKGSSMGAAGETIGEVVFNTCTASYHELLSDPTYYGQIVAQTYPLVGNRGMEKDIFSSNITANGYIAREWCDTPTDLHEGITLDEYLKSRNIVGICGIDTRRLTRTLRDKGYFNGAITNSLDDFDKLMCKIDSYSIHGAVEAVTIKETIKYYADVSKFNVVVIDYGFSRLMLKSLTDRECNLTVVPARTNPEEIMKFNPDGLVFTDGPGDPDDDPVLIENIKKLISAKIPTLGIGVGHQMLVLATGGKINKMPKGHRGSNQPVRICGTDKVMVTNQNHGYDVADGSQGENIAEVILRNVNDGSIEGLIYKLFPCLSIQFIPADSRVYSDTSWIYDKFIDLIKGAGEHE
jgi:carbamoyl-phosphate synthase small subunit